MKRSLVSSPSKKSTKKVAVHDAASYTKKRAIFSGGVTKAVKPVHDRMVRVRSVSASGVAKKIASSPLRKRFNRYAKRGIKSMLLSPVFHASFKAFVLFAIGSGLLYSSYLFISRTFANEVVVSQSEIIARVGKLTSLPQEEPYEIVRVQDDEDLKKQNVFYKDIKEGDYIIMYKDMAVIFDLRNNTIINMKKSEDVKVR